MEILSIGEKIKRARIYKDCTLKELCGDKISISKMSCIENDKVKPERWIIDFIAEKLDMDKEYLNQGVREQISYNINWLKDNKDSSNYEEYIRYNLEFSMQYSHFDLGFELMHMLFEFYISRNEMERIQEITSQYYDISSKSNLEDNQITYYNDMARYFFKNKEYNQSAAYYNNLVGILQNNNSDRYDEIVSLMYKEAVCYLALRDYEKAYDISKDIVNFIDYAKEQDKKAEIYAMLAQLALRMNTGDFETYEQKSYQCYGDKFESKAKAMYSYSEAMFELGSKDKAISYINGGLEIHPKENIEEYVKYVLLCVSQLVKNDVIDQAQDLCDEALNNSITLQNIGFIERSYYYKSKIAEKLGSLISAEMYMNLSLDALFKVGTKQQKYERYIEMGNMYHKLGQIDDSLKYFSLAMALERKM